MKIIIGGVDVTASVTVKSAEMTEYSGGRTDALEIEFENGEAWHGWQIAPDTTIRITHKGYDTGIMYVRYTLPENDTYRIIATAIKCGANRKGNKCYQSLTLNQLYAICADECGMQYRLWGMDGNTAYRTLLRRNESPIAFLTEITKREGGTLKVTGGTLVGIGYQEAEKLSASAAIEISDRQYGVSYVKRDADKWKRLYVVSPEATVFSEDMGADGGAEEKTVTLPASDAGMAGRWARGLLAQHNRECESITVMSEFNAGFTAMARVDLKGGTDAKGKWIISECSHDFVNDKSTATLQRATVKVR